ncbi:MAG: hypothetical protein SGJ27_20705 [Candidatus Melainabacteria bacterium]|nr:hypothetical protein [Candidatus Melainabacteria bacterium]
MFSRLLLSKKNSRISPFLGRMTTSLVGDGRATSSTIGKIAPSSSGGRIATSLVNGKIATSSNGGRIATSLVDGKIAASLFGDRIAISSNSKVALAALLTRTAGSVLAFSALICGPVFADDSADFFKFKNSDFFEIDDKRSDDKKRQEKKEEREDEQRRKLDDKWTNRPDNPKNIWQETFVDTDFSMHKFRDLKNNNDLNAMAASRDRKDFGSRTDPDAKRADDDLDIDKSDRDDYRRRMREDDFRTFRDLTEPIPGMFHDWVPSPLDREQNGGFTGAPDNGFVVPYKLNGWIEIERKLPWEAEP